MHPPVIGWQAALLLPLCAHVELYCYCHMDQEMSEHPVGSQRGLWGISVMIPSVSYVALRECTVWLSEVGWAHVRKGLHNSITVFCHAGQFL
jgi:hypothetical protein